MASTIRKDLRTVPNVITLSRIVLLWLGVLVYFYVSHGVGIALSILADAGYDPWQAPEAWRLLEPKKPPTATDSLKYPSHSGYLLGVLNLQYRQRAASALPAGASGDSPNQ